MIGGPMASFLSTEASAAEVQFSKARLKLGSTTLAIELAETSAQLERGLMFRKELTESGGMLFVYKREAPLTFWMKNTFIPLSIGFFNAKKELIDIQDMEPVKSEMQAQVPTYESRGAAQYALEVRQGWFERHNIKVKTKFALEKEKARP